VRIPQCDYVVLEGNSPIREACHGKDKYTIADYPCWQCKPCGFPAVSMCVEILVKCGRDPDIISIADRPPATFVLTHIPGPPERWVGTLNWVDIFTGIPGSFPIVVNCDSTPPFPWRLEINGTEVCRGVRDTCLPIITFEQCEYCQFWPGTTGVPPVDTQGQLCDVVPDESWYCVPTTNVEGKATKACLDFTNQPEPWPFFSGPHLNKGACEGTCSSEHWYCVLDQFYGKGDSPIGPATRRCVNDINTVLGVELETTDSKGKTISVASDGPFPSAGCCEAACKTVRGYQPTFTMSSARAAPMGQVVVTGRTEPLARESFCIHLGVRQPPYSCCPRNDGHTCDLAESDSRVALVLLGGLAVPSDHCQRCVGYEP
jgi:hypothetical protein